MANITPDGAELDQLLARLLRAVAPRFGAAGGHGDSDLTQGQSGAGPSDALAQPGGSAPAYSPPAGGPPEGRTAAPANGRTPSVSASEARALIELMSARGIAQGELAGLLGLDKSTVSRLASGLERKGWIRRGRDAANQRYVRLYLTPAGGAIAGRLLGGWQSRQARILAVLSAEERAGLAAGLRGLMRGLATEGLLAAGTGDQERGEDSGPAASRI